MSKLIQELNDKPSTDKEWLIYLNQKSKKLKSLTDSVLTELDEIFRDVETENPEYFKKLRQEYPELF